MTYRDVLGNISSGTLGYIFNGYRGANRAVVAYNSYRNMPPMKRKLSTSISGAVTKRRRVTMKSLRRKRPQSQGKYVKVRVVRKARRGSRGQGRGVLSNKAKSAVRRIATRVLHGELPKGKYVKNVTYLAPSSSGATNAEVQTVYDSFTFQGSALPDSTMAVGTYYKIMDAVSILWSSKAATFINNDTGNDSPANMIVPDVKHTGTYEFVNNTHGTEVLRIYECCTKEDTDNGVYTNYTSMTTNQKGGTVRSKTYLGVVPEMFAQFRDQYNYKVKEIRLAPGKRFKLSHSTSISHLKFDQWMKIGTSTPFLYRKNFTKEILIIGYTAVTTGYPLTGSYTATVNHLATGLGFGIGVQMTDVITTRCPENITSVNNDDNAVCIWNYFDKDIDTTNADTILAPAITEVVPYS